MANTILIVDDEKNIRDGLAVNFEMEGYETKVAETGSIALDIVKNGGIDLVITDLRMPGRIGGEEVLRRITTEYPSIPVIILTGHGSVDSAVEAMKNGAFEFLTKPLDLEHLGLVVQRALENRNSKLQIETLKKEISDSEKTLKLGNIVGTSQKMQKVLQMVKKVAPTKATVLITGETGVGKEGIAQALHDLSPRSGKPMLKVNCASFSESLLESELFGYEKGAFTGADKTHKGRFELADGGTIFLDEIGEINEATQVKLLRVLQEKKFERIGGEKTLSVDVRIVAATNRNLEKACEEGRFRKDLFYRLNEFSVEVPPLRERKDDIQELMNDFLEDYNGENGTSIKSFDKESRNILLSYEWPGNIRELQNCVRRSAVMCDGEIIKKEDLPPSLIDSLDEKNASMDVEKTVLDKKTDSQEKSGIFIPLGTTLEEAKNIIIEETLKANQGNKTKTAQILGINRKTLQRN